MNEEIKLALIRVFPFVMILVGLFVATKRGKIDRAADLGLQKPSSMTHFFFWTFGFLSFILLIEFFLNKSGILEIDKWNHPFFSSIIRIVGAVILAPISEELIFRGLLLSKLSKKVNMHLAILIQACFFVLLHNFAYQNTLTSNIVIVQALIDATLFGYGRHYTKSIYTPITMHVTGNIIATLERFIF
ncbi:CAAX prenyl protease-like protein [Flavobacterium sp. 103]|uniref:CPBP family intramembrane glutamic endopeptidase n=1 Tax=Flavobacterium sp. 103 TaxID=2135624 RepID=UPI000D5FB20B|nr:CPBP family intramembrane glutamic endopeptidase [Flavobacterium sp. 103]PVX44422.1 CAAX prenyl protease-like protein [Flavobacterium sp. 103]